MTELLLLTSSSGSVHFTSRFTPLDALTTLSSRLSNGGEKGLHPCENDEGNTSDEEDRLEDLISLIVLWKFDLQLF